MKERLWRDALRGFSSLALLALAVESQAAGLTHLQVEYLDRPLAIESSAPRFSWQAVSDRKVRGYQQAAYQIRVTDSGGAPVWDSGRVTGSSSLAIAYAGMALKPATAYRWSVLTWDTQGRKAAASSTFETGLMDSRSGLAVWEGAQWIGGTDTDLPLYAQYLPIFKLDFTVTIAAGSQRAAMVLAANDPRLMDPNRNIFQLRAARNQSWFKVELDAGNPGGDAHLNIYRAGYSRDDSPDRPYASWRIRTALINDANRHAAHHVSVQATFGKLRFRVDDQEEFFVVDPAAPVAAPNPFGATDNGAAINLNPAGDGGNFITYGYLCEIGFAAAPGQSASFTDVRVSNVRAPGNLLFSEDLTRGNYAGIYARYTSDPGSGLRVAGGAYQLSGGGNGAFVVADPSHNAMPMLRTRFQLPGKRVAAARLYATARGIYELYLNGQRVGDSYYAPGLTQYNRTQLYQVYDVTRLVNKGPNALGAMLGEGWWSGMLSFGTVWNHFGDRQSLLAKLVVTYSDGTRAVVTSNERDWKYFNDGPVRYSSLDLGEVYDASRDGAVVGWSTASYDDRAWLPAHSVALRGTAFDGKETGMMASADLGFDRLQVVADMDEPVRAFKVLTAGSVREVRHGVYLYDMGQNIVGVPRVHFARGVAGRTVTFRVGEMLYPDQPASGGNVGMVMTENYRAALSQDQYLMKSGAQDFQPRFTSHGFRYLEISGIDAPLPLAQVQAVSMSSVQKLTAGFASSNARVNRLWENLTWSNVDNFLSIPTDCPQRNERMGWSGDISVFSRTATYLSAAEPFLRRHMLAMRDVQQPSGKFTDIAPVGGGFGGLLWGSAGITVAWESYLQYADLELLREHYPAMKAYVDYLATTIDPKTGLSRDVQLGDWLGPQNNQLGAAFPATAYHVYDLGIVASVAELLGFDAEAAKYRAQYADRKAFFNRTFIDADGRTLGQKGGGMMGFTPGAAPPPFTVADTQTSYAVGLALGVFDDDKVPAMRANLAAAVERPNLDDEGRERPAFSLMTGFIGTAWISDALSGAGRSDLAYRLLQTSTYPSWLYAVDQGATTIWERLNGYTVDAGFGGNNSMNSFNHYSFGAVGQWIMAHSLGIERDAPGFQSFVLQPEPDPTGQMTWAKGHYDSPYGRIEATWRRQGGAVDYEFTVPPNTTATLYLEAGSAAAVTEGGHPAADSSGVKFLSAQNKHVVYRLGSGSYHFTVKS